VLVSPKAPLSLERVAILWACELDEPVEETARILIRAYDAAWYDDAISQLVEDRQLLGAPKVGLKTSDTGRWAHCPDDLLECVDACEYSHVGYSIAVLGPDCQLVGELLRKVEVTCEEFLRWVDRAGYRRPKFWDGPESAAGVEPAPTPPVADPARPPATAVKRLSPERDRVLALMRADIKGGKVTLEDLGRKRDAWAATYKTGATTVRDAVALLREELALSRALRRSQAAAQERPQNDSD
jgi:hypothetical protein